MAMGSEVLAAACNGDVGLADKAALHVPKHLVLLPFHGFLKNNAFSTSLFAPSRASFNHKKCQASRLRVLAAASSSATVEALPSLTDLPFNAFINSQGRISPPLQPNTAATIFAIFDQNKKVQYVGFSKDIRNSLRTLIARRPELCYYYKLHSFPVLDQQALLALRQQWFSELGAIPNGNADPKQRGFWEKPSEASSISERGKSAAAKDKAKTLKQMLVDRGLKEEVTFDPKLLEEGKCDILPSVEHSRKDAEDDTSVRKHVVIQIPSGGSIDYDIAYDMKFKTNGGWMYDILVTKDDRETRHRVICGRIYPEAAGMPEDNFLEVVIGFLLYKKIPRHTEGMRDVATFPINYFAVGEVAQNFDDFKDWFTAELPDNYWRFTKLNSYGAQIDPPPPVGPEDYLPVESKPQYEVTEL